MPPIRLQRFNSFAELVYFIQSHHSSNQGTIVGDTFGGGWAEDTGLQATGTGSQGYSTTNVQVEGVDEPDHVKNDGTYIYTITEEEVVVVQGFPAEELGIVSRFQPIGTPNTLFLCDSSQLVVISTIFSNQVEWPQPEEVAIEVYEVTNPANPQLEQQIIVEGEYLGARLVNNHLYFLANRWVTDDNGTIVLPGLTVGDTDLFIPANEIYYDAGTYDYSFQYTIVLGLDVTNSAAAPEIETFLGGCSTSIIYTSLTNLYLACARYPIYSDGLEGTNTVIHRCKIEEGAITYETSGQVPGYLINQFALDEFRGHLRVATTSWVSSSTPNSDEFSSTETQVSNVYTLNMHLDIKGRLEGLAPGERIYSVRFMGETGYLVTFYKVDPLFVIDLSIPTHPSLLGELEVTGYSDYLHPLSDQYLLGVGKDVAISEDQSWWWYQGVKISLFNTTDPCQPEEPFRLTMGVRGTDSALLHDHKAILIDLSRQLLVFPILLAEHPENTTNVPPYESGEYVWQGAYIFHFDLTTPAFTLLHQVSHISNNTALADDPWAHRPYYINRALYIGNILYTLSSYKLTLHDLTNFSTLGEVIIDPALNP
jgi:uncharacterized secreted protein with C-terminal beta-propeller domain